MNKTQEELVEIYNQLSNCCEGIYQGGSHVDPVIDNPHDYDYICFAKYLCMTKIKTKLVELGLAKSGSKSKKADPNWLLDFSQIRVYPYTQITWFSYLDKLMILKAGKDICPKTDIISDYRTKFIAEIKQKAKLLLNSTITNQKRWYHILRGVYILLNNSYEVTDEQKKEINILHDLSEGWEEIRDKTKYLLDILK